MNEQFGNNSIVGEPGTKTSPYLRRKLRLEVDYDGNWEFGMDVLAMVGEFLF